jgi:hypothetical protein
MENKPSDSTPAAGAFIKSVAAEFEVALDQISVDPRDLPRWAIARIVKFNYPTPERERHAAQSVRGYYPQIERLIVAGDLSGLERIVAEMEDVCRRLSIPERPKNFHEQLRELIGYFYNASWSIEETEAVRYLWRHGENLGAITPSSVKCGARTVTREEVRAEMAKRGVSHEFLREKAEIEKHRTEIDAKNVERRARGEGAIHYTGH